MSVHNIMNYLKYALARNNKKSHAEPVQPPIEEHRELRKRMKTIDIEEEIGRDEESIRNDVHLLQLSRWLKEAYLRDGNAPTDVALHKCSPSVTT